MDGEHRNRDQQEVGAGLPEDVAERAVQRHGAVEKLQRQRQPAERRGDRYRQRQQREENGEGFD